MPETEQRAGSTVDIRQFPWVRRLAADYAFHFDALAPFFAGDPARAESWREAIDRTLTRPLPRPDVAAILASQLQARGAPPEARAGVETLARPDAVAIVTGQQAGLFGGPLFILFKALTAIALADRVRTQHAAPAVPVFWVEAEDHDWAEVSTCTLLDAELQPRALTLDVAVPPGAPVASVTLPEGITTLLAELEALLPQSEHRGVVLAMLRDAYRPGRGMAEAFAGWLDQLLGPLGLVVFDASDPRAKPLVREVFARELEAPAETARLARQAGAALTELGYHLQVEAGDGPALFRLDGRRTPIRLDGDRCLVHEASVSTAELASAALQEPERFSPSVLLRPIVQDALFPTVCYVAGPSELAYLGQLRGVYEHFGVPMPLCHPRATATLLDSGALRFLARYELPLSALRAQDESALNRLLLSQIPPAVEEAFAETGQILDAQLTTLAARVSVVDPTLEGAVRSTAGRLEHELGKLHGKLLQAAKRRDQTLRRQFGHTQAQAFPAGQPQERAIAGVSFLARYGFGLIERLRDTLPIDPGEHGILTP